MALIVVLYAIVTVIFIGGGYLPKIFVEKKGMNPYNGRMLAMLIFAFFPLLALFAQPLGIGLNSAWWPAIIIGLAGAGHQAWSANLFSTIGDMFPKSMVATSPVSVVWQVVSARSSSIRVQAGSSPTQKDWARHSLYSVSMASSVATW